MKTFPPIGSTVLLKHKGRRYRPILGEAKVISLLMMSRCFSNHRHVVVDHGGEEVTVTLGQIDRVCDGGGK